jgi:hypothetical protein
MFFVTTASAGFALLLAACNIVFQPYEGPTNAPRLYVGGDSITADSVNDINAHFQSSFQVRIDGWSGASSERMAPNTQDAAASMPDVAVIELGTNDPTPYYNMTLDQSETWLEQINSYFAPSTCVIFVTPWHGTIQRPPGSLEAIAQFERVAFPRLADWDQAATAADYTGGDGIHPNATGLLHLVQVEATAIAGCPTNPTSTKTTTSVAPAG